MAEVELLENSSEKLCEIVVSYYVLGIGKEIAVLAMQELASRRAKGDQFKFEEYISNLQKEIPEITFSLKK